MAVTRLASTKGKVMSTPGRGTAFFCCVPITFAPHCRLFDGGACPFSNRRAGGIFCCKAADPLDILVGRGPQPLSAQGEACESMPEADGHDTMCIGDISRELEKAVKHGQASQTSEGPEGDTEWMSSSERPSGGRSWTDPCGEIDPLFPLPNLCLEPALMSHFLVFHPVFSNAFILWVSWFLATLHNYELSLLAFLLFCASMGYHLSGETNMRCAK